MTTSALADAAGAVGLDILGTLQTVDSDPIPDHVRSIALLGPGEPGFWNMFRETPEYRDSSPDSMDRWSRRVITRLAEDLGGTPMFPFSGPPWLPFIEWAKRSGRVWQSDAFLLIHDRAGLMVSFRGAIGFEHVIETSEDRPSRPCDACPDKPCRSACPVSALHPDFYDVPTCKGFLDTAPGEDCMSSGCKVRRACPVSRQYGRLPEQSAYHMRHFHP